MQICQIILKFNSTYFKVSFKNFDGTIPDNLSSECSHSLPLSEGYLLFKEVEKLIEGFQLNKALEEIFIFISKLNKFMDESEPWNVIKENKEQAGIVMIKLIEGFRILGIILQPFLPFASKTILDTLNINNDIRTFKFLNSNHSLKKGHKINEPKGSFSKI